MRLSLASSILVPFVVAQSVSAYFKVTHPTSEAKWANGQAYTVTWDKGLKDEIDIIDIEMTTVTGNGLILVAKNVQAHWGGINILIENVPPADNWVVLCVNSTHGNSYGTSEPFTILPASSSGDAIAEKALDKVPTVTVTSGPNPTAFFQTTLAGDASISAKDVVGQLRRGAGGMLGVLGAGMVGAAWVLL